MSSALRAKCNCRAFKKKPTYLSEINEDLILQSRIRDYHMRCDDSEEEEEEFHDGEAHFYKDFAAYLSRVWMESSLAEKYYRKAMEIQPCNWHLLRKYAEFAWDELGNPKKAKEIYEYALQEHPEDVKLLGSYAFFLWKVDGSK
ncbi:hypothetical protein SUGI_0599710 [Cryptomeria japonica]|nr:hypothetical protein SUGI_0599710 [Cryptomeria japonica]